MELPQSLTGEQVRRLLVSTLPADDPERAAEGVSTGEVRALSTQQRLKLLETLLADTRKVADDCAMSHQVLSVILDKTRQDPSRNIH
jgi:hypothetical protein